MMSKINNFYFQTIAAKNKLEKLRLNIAMPGIKPQKVRNLQVFGNF